MKKLKLLLLIAGILSITPLIANAKEEDEFLYNYIGVYSEGRAVAGIWGHRWIYGYIDNMAQTVIQPKYREARDFSGGAASVGVGDTDKPIKYGFINKDGSYLIDPKFDETGDFHKIPTTNTEIAMIGVGESKAGRKYGFVLKDGSYFVNPQFDGVSGYWSLGSCGYNIVYNEKNGKKLYGLLDSNGKLILDTKYSSISISKHNVAKGYIDVRSEPLYGFYDIKRGTLIEPEFTSVGVVTDYGVKTIKKVNGKDKHGFYFNGGKIVEPKYDWFWHWDSEDILYKIELNGKFGLLGKNGEEIAEAKYDELRDLGSWIYAMLNGKESLITKKGKLVDDKKFDSMSSIGNYDILMVEANGKKGLFDLKDSSYLVKPKYDEIYSYFEDGYAKVVLNGKQGIIGRSGKLLLEPVYDYIYTNFYTDQIKVEEINADGTKSFTYQDDKSKPPVVKVKKDGKEYFLNSDFTPFKNEYNSSVKNDENSAAGDYDSIDIFEGEVARVMKGNKVGYIRKDFSYVVKPVWDSAFRAVNTSDPKGGYYDYFHIQKAGKWGIVFMDGTIIEPVSDNMAAIGEEIASITIKGKNKYMNKNGALLNNEEYLQALPFSEGKGLVQYKPAEWYFIGAKGKKASDTYMNATSYGEGLAFVFTKTGGRYIDHSGKIVLGEKTNFVHGYPFKNGIALALWYSAEKGTVIYGLLKKDGTWLIEPVFDRVDLYGDFNYRYYLNGKEAQVTADGKINWK